MKKAMLASVMFFMMISVGVANDSNVYITQSDSATGLAIDIHIDGTGSEVGVSGSSNEGDFEVSGASNNIDIDLIGGTGNKVYGELKNTSENTTGDDLDIQVDGASNITTVLVGSNTATADVKIDQDVTGDSNVVKYEIGNSFASFGGTGAGAATTITYGSTVTNATVQDLQVTVNLGSDSANVRLTDIGTAAADTTTSVTVLGSSNTQDIDIFKQGAGAHNTTLRLGGATNTVLIGQEGSGATTTDIDSDGGTSNINAYIGTAGTIDLEINGAGADVDVTVLP